MEKFGELRSLCSGPGDDRRFKRILTFLESGDQEQVKEQMLPYVQEHLASWPDALRTCPDSELEVFEKDKVVWAPLVRRVNYEDAGLNQKRLKRLMEAEHLGDVTEINLGACRLKWDKLNEFAQKSPFSGLKVLQFRRSVKPTEIKLLGSFLSSPLCKKIESLSLKRWKGFSPKILDTFAREFPLANLRHLDLSGCKISQKQLGPFLTKGHLDQLESLELRDDRLDGIDFQGSGRTVASHEGFQQLKSLRLDTLDEEELVHFATAEHLSSLEHVLLGVRTKEGFPNVCAWLESELVSGIKELELRLDSHRGAPEGCVYDADVLKTLATSEALVSLESLCVRSWRLQVEDAEPLRESPRFQGLESFELDYKVDLVALQRYKRLQKEKRLSMN